MFALRVLELASLTMSTALRSMQHQDHASLLTIATSSFMRPQYYDIVTTVEPKRLALAEANEQLNEANST